MNIEARFKVLNIKVVSDEEFNYSRISNLNTSCILKNSDLLYVL